MLPIVILAINDEQDRAFMSQLYLTHRGLMYKKACAVLHDTQDVEDVIADACVALIDKIPLIRQMNGYTCRAYIVSTVRNTAINHIVRRDRQGKHAFLTDGEALLAVEDFEPQALEALIDRQQIDQLKRVIAELPERARLVMTMKYFDDLPDADIGRLLGMKPDSVRPCLMRARRLVYERMKE